MTEGQDASQLCLSMIPPKVVEFVDNLGPDSQGIAKELVTVARAGNLKGTQDLLDQVFREIPVPMKEFIESPKYLGLKGLVYENIQILAEYVEEPHIHESSQIIGKGAGKSFSSSLFLARGLYELRCYRDFRNFFRLPAEDVYCLNLSTSQGQANKVVFGKLKNLLTRSPWFKGELRERKNELMLDEGIGALSGHSGSRAWEGFTLYRGVLDEADHLMDNTKKVVAEDLYNLLKEQAQSRFPVHWKVLAISFLRSATSFMHRKYDEIVKTGKPIRILKEIPQEPVPDCSIKPEDFPAEVYLDGDTVIVKAPSWQFNPRTPFKTYAKGFKREPQRTSRVHGSKAIAGIEDYVKAPAILETCINKDLKHPVEFTEQGTWHIADWFKPKRVSYFMHMDMSARKDATGLALCHWDNRKKKVVMDLMLDIEVPEGGELLIKRNRELVFTLVKLGFYIRKVTADGWQSLETFQALTQRGIEAEWYSVDKNTEAYDTVMDLIYESMIEYYRHAKWLKEMRELQIRGKKIDHPSTGSKDLADAVAGAVRNCFLDLPMDLVKIRTVG